MYCLNKVFIKYDKIILDSISLKIEDKRICVIKGKNGTGKSTLLKVLANTIDHEGLVLLNGENIDNMNDYLAKKVCYIPQFTSFFESLDANSNLLLCNKFTKGIYEKKSDYIHTKKKQH